MNLRAHRESVRARLVGPGALVLIALTALSARAENLPRTADWLSDQTFAYAEILQPARLADHLHEARVLRLLKAVPGLESALEKKEVRDLKTVAGLVSNALDLSAKDAIRSLTKGGIVLAVEGETGPERVVLTVSPEDPSLLEKAHARLLELARSDAKRKGKPDPVREFSHEGTLCYSVSPKEAHAILDGLLVATNGPETLKTLIDRVQGRAKFTPLTDDAVWSKQRAGVDEDAAAFAFVRLETLRRIDPKKFAFGAGKADARGTFLLGYWLDLLREGDWASASASWTDTRLAATLTLPVPEGGVSDALSAFRPSQGQGAPGLVQPPGTILSVGLWKDLEALWEVRDQLLPPEAVQKLSGLDSFAGQFFGGRDFGSGVLGSLGHDWRLVVANQDYANMSPSPDLKLPGFALLIPLGPEDEEFAVRLQAAFQSFVGLVNLGAAKKQAPPLMLGSEQAGETTISSASYVASSREAEGPVDQRFNFSPSAFRKGHTFVLSSSLDLARSLVASLEEPSEPSLETLVAEADGPSLARLVEVNRDQLAMRNMLKKGNDRSQAESEVDLLASLLRYLGHGRMTVSDQDTQSRLMIEFRLGE